MGLSCPSYKSEQNASGIIQNLKIGQHISPWNLHFFTEIVNFCLILRNTKYEFLISFLWDLLHLGMWVLNLSGAIR